MNNKKLFKGALVLFASILMAVSCSSNTNPENEKKDEAQVTTITDTQIQKALRDAFGSTELNLESGGKTKANFGSGTYANGIFSVTGTFNTTQPSKATFNKIITTDKKENIISELDKIGIIVTPVNIAKFSSTGDATVATGGFDISIKENYKLQNNKTKITISVTVESTTWGA